MGANVARIDQIDDGFFICGVPALENVEVLHALGIRYILNVGRESLYTRGRNLIEKLKPFKVKTMEADDSEAQDLSPYFDEMTKFIDDGRKEGGVVVHCAAGISRSSTACLAFLMMKERFTLAAAFRKVQQARVFILPNSGFWRQLRKLEKELQTQGKELRELHDDEMPPFEFPGKQLWEVLGGADKGGVIVRDQSQLSSSQQAARLATGSIVVEQELIGERLHYKRVLGTGPMRGWISITISNKVLAQRVSGDALTWATIRRLDGEAEAEANVSLTSFFVAANVVLSEKCGSVEDIAAELSASAPPNGLIWQSVQSLDGRTLLVRAKLQASDVVSRSGGDEAVRKAVLHALGPEAVESIVVERPLAT